MAATDERGHLGRRVLIALLGPTGAGKTTFVQLASGNKDLQVGHGIYPCTQDPQVVEFTIPTDPGNHPILLIDTPGFDDDNRTDVEILEDIAKWLNKQGYLRGSDQLDGLIFLHPVTVHRLGGQERRRTRLLQNLLGPNAFKRIIIATTMWEKIRDDDLKDVEAAVRAREKDIWYDLVKGGHGAKLRRHYKTTNSAHEIIKEIIRLSEKYGKIEPLVQEELRRDPKLIRTTAGRSMKKDLQSDIRRAKALLDKHRLAKPEKPHKTDKSPQNTTLKKEYDEWLEEDEELRKRLGRLEANMVKLHGMKFGVWGRFFSFFRSSK